MKKPPIPSNEVERLRALLESSLLDTPREEFFDKLTELAASICGTEFAAVSLIDEKRQWFKSKFGFEMDETPRDIAFCAHAIMGDKMFEINDAQADERFAENPFVKEDPNIRFYAGVPLINKDGLALGTLCVFDKRVKALQDFQATTLEALAKKIVSYIEEKKLK